MSSSVRLVLVEPEWVSEAWNEAGPLLAKALRRSRGETSARAEYERLTSGQTQLWLARLDEQTVAAAISRFHNYPGKRVLILYLLGGSLMREWLCLEPQMDAWAKANGCAGLRLEGRRGWRRALRHWEEMRIVMGKDY